MISDKRIKFLDELDFMRELDKPDIGFVIRSLVIASMPHSRVSTFFYKRKSNHVTLTILGHEECGGVPYGSYPRLILLWLVTEVTKTRSREIVLGRSLSSFMKKMGIQVTGGQNGTIQRFKEQLKRLFSCHITVIFSNKDRTATKQMNVVDKAQIFWDSDTLNPNNLFKSRIRLGEEFYNEIVSAPIPVSLEAVKILKDNSLALDIYFWLTYRVSYLKMSAEIPFDSLYLQFGMEYQTTRQGKYEFKNKFLTQLRKVKLIYPDINIRETKDGIIVDPSFTHISKN